MNVIIKYKNNVKSFLNQNAIIIGNSTNCDYKIPELPFNTEIKLLYAKQYNNYIVVNSANDNTILYNNSFFTRRLVNPRFILNFTGIKIDLLISIINSDSVSTVSDNVKPIPTNTTKTAMNYSKLSDDELEQARISVINEIGSKINTLKKQTVLSSLSNNLCNVAILILSLIASFSVTNFLLGIKISTTTNVLNLTTNYGACVGFSVIILAISFLLKQGVYSYIIETNRNSKFAAQIMMSVSLFVMLIIYFINLIYLRSIPNYIFSAFFVAFFIVGSLTLVTLGSGYIKSQIENNNRELLMTEYREDFEAIIKCYRQYISKFVNALSSNKINNIKSTLLNKQMQMIVETFIGILTAPFLAYGVSNTLASCFPEAANWVRIAGLRFSPIFLVLATFLIIFAFFSFVRAFTIGKQTKSSEIIKYDGFHDYNFHGVTIYGLDALRLLEKERKVVLFIACFIIMIEFTMNVTYFITEMGADMQGFLISIIIALVPTALLIAETHMLSATMHKINNYNELLAILD